MRFRLTSTPMLLLGSGALLLASYFVFRKPWDAIVVLGISDRVEAQRRVDFAAPYFTKTKIVLFSGKGAGIDGQPEAEWMYGKAASRIPDGVEVLLDTQAMSTKQNVQNAAQLLHGKAKRILVVSSHEHVQSAAYCLSTAGFDAKYSQSGSLPTVPPQNCARAGCCNGVLA